MTESLLGDVNMAALLGDPKTNPVPESPLEAELAVVSPEEATVATPAEASFSFRGLLSQQEQQALKARAPELAARMVTDHNAIISFGDPVLTKLNNVSSQLLKEQSAIDLPEADKIVNDVLAEINGYSARFRSDSVDSAMEKFKNFFGKARNSFRAMVDEAKPIDQKLQMAEAKLLEMELSLKDNIDRGGFLHKSILTSLQETVLVLAALEEIQEVVGADFEEADALVRELDGHAEVQEVTFKGERITSQELRERHGVLSTAVAELDKTWHDWRQQLFLGYGLAPSTRNVILVSSTMQRRCKAFRTMGIPSARTSLAMWQQAALAQEAAETGSRIQDGTNTLVQDAFTATGTAVRETAMASQASVINEDTIWTVVDSIKAQCEGLVAAEKWGRAERARSLEAMQKGEAAIKESFSGSRSALVKEVVAASHIVPAPAPAPDVNVLKTIGVE